MNRLVELYGTYGLLGGFAVAGTFGAIVAGITWLALRRRGIGLPAVVGLLAIGLVLGGTLFVDRMRLKRIGGALHEVHLVGEGADAMILVVDRLEKIGLGRKKGWIYRLSAYSLARGGERTARTILGVDEPGWIGEVAGRAWMRSPDLGVHARDPVTLALIAREKNLVDKNAELAGGVKGLRPDASGVGLVVTNHTGRELWLDGATLELREPPGDSVAVAARHRLRAPLPILLREDGAVERTGPGAWTARPADGVIAVHASGDAVVAFTTSGMIALDAATGAVRWSVQR